MHLGVRFTHLILKTKPMMKRYLLFSLASLLPSAGWAVYAPIPEEDQGKAFVTRLSGGIYHDTNIFGGATDEISSVVYRVSPSLSFNSSVTDQTFLSAGYILTYDHVVDRPQNTDLTSHTASLRIAHAFSDATTIDFNEQFMVAQNPESLLAGIPLNTDQSFDNNQFDATFEHALTDRMGMTVKGRSMYYAFDLPALADALDRHELLLGISANYSVSPATKISGEYRYLDVGYYNGGSLKNKESHYVLGGFDYAPSENLAIMARAGWEMRSRSGAPDEDSPYAEVTARYSYGENSFFSAGYVLGIEEVSNVAVYTDIEVNRVFASVQHAFSPLLIGSAFYSVEPSTLRGRSGLSPDQDETTQRFGGALTYRPRRAWAVAATLDIDSTDSDDATRDLSRTRIGIDVRYSF